MGEDKVTEKYGAINNVDIVCVDSADTLSKKLGVSMFEDFTLDLDESCEGEAEVAHLAKLIESTKAPFSASILKRARSTIATAEAQADSSTAVPEPVDDLQVLPGQVLTPLHPG